MADVARKFSGNVKGTFFVDSACIDCDLCRQIAPAFFKQQYSNGATHSIVYRQPATPDEVRKCQEALAACPVEAIGCVAHCEKKKLSNKEETSVCAVA